VTVTPNGLVVTHDPTVATLHEHNVGWRTGLDYAPTQNVLFYGNVSQGYKAGAFPLIAGTSSIENRPVTQEKVLAYEIGGKATLLDRTLQLNGALFYYDYTNKQIQGRILDPLGIFGALDALVNVPRSRIEGAELQLTYQPLRGLTLNAAASYIDSKVTSNFMNYDPLANEINFKGLEFPYTPKISAVASTQYEWPVGGDLDAFAGGNFTYTGNITTAFANPSAVATTPSDPLNAPGKTVPGNIFELPGYGVAGFDVGLASPAHHLRTSLWVRNAFNKFYLTNTSHGTDDIIGYTGMPRTYGISLSYRF